MIFKNISIDNENEKVDFTIQFDISEFRDFKYILEHNRGSNDSFEHLKVKFLETGDGLEDNVEALLIEAPSMTENKNDRLLDFICSLYAFCDISFPYGDYYIV